MRVSAVHRLSMIGILAFLVAYAVLVWLLSPRGGFLTEIWMLPTALGRFYGAWAAILTITLISFVVRSSNQAAITLSMTALVSFPLIWIAWDILSMAHSLPYYEYWGYFREMALFRWLLAPSFAGYALTLAIACVGLWVTTKPRLG